MSVSALCQLNESIVTEASKTPLVACVGVHDRRRKRQLANRVRSRTSTRRNGSSVPDHRPIVPNNATTYVTVYRDGKKLLTVTGRNIDLDRSQGEVGLFVPDAGYAARARKLDTVREV